MICCKIYIAGTASHDRRIGSWGQSYDFCIYNYKASVVIGYIVRRIHFLFSKRTRLLVVL
jgi:hypothetical protein